MQHKGWSIFFGAVLLASFLLWAVAPFVGWWLPDNVSSYGPDVDYLYYVILAFTGFFFVLTEALLVYAMYRFAGRPGGRSDYIEGNHRLEMMWTIVPAAILIYIAVAQINTWERIKYQAKMPEPDLVMQVMARQWDWSMRYADTPHPANPRLWSEIPAIDDIYLPDELHCWKGANVRIFLKTQDVLHSLFLPQLRLKQDALPGKTIPMWFNATDFNAKFNEKTGKCELTDKSKEWEIACAELCGGGHYRMRGLLFVHETKEDYLKWFKYAQAAARSRKPEMEMPAVAANE
ncbi:MAG: cytochrome c oxidase subunit II [Gemmataceae bacterium]